MFDYDKVKEKIESEGNQWASYSDLFMVLSFVFLLLYVTSSLRNGTFSIQKHIEYKRMAHEAADLQEQIRVYNSLKNEYLETGATEKEKDNYENLMAQLDLLQTEADQEAKELQQKAQEHKQKKTALNKYQQMVRNIINTNMVAQSRIKKRDNIIADKEEVIKEKEEVIVQKQQEITERQKEIKGLEKDISQKKSEIAKNERAIKKINSTLDKKIAQLKKQAKKYKKSKKQLNKQIAKLKTTSEQKIKELSTQSQQVEAQLSKVSKDLNQQTYALQMAKNQVEREKLEKQRLSQKFEEEVKTLKENYKKQITGKEAEYERQLANLDAKFKNKYKSQEEQYQAYLKEQQKNYQSEIAKRKQQISAAKAKNKKVSKSLAAAQEKEKARQRIITQIKENFKKAGMDVEVDGQTGDVVLSFGKEYFETGKAQLKPGMTNMLQKFIPVYAKSLFESEEVAKKLSNVEIIGYASPTYKGKYVDPGSLKKGDREAVNYNMDLSYRRAKSIFNHIFNKDKMTYKNQQELLPLVKVTGKSFLAEAKSQRGIASGTSVKDFCKEYDCKKAQKVIIKFNLQND